MIQITDFNQSTLVMSHVIQALADYHSVFSHSNYPLSLHGKTNLYDYQTLNETNAVC